MEAMAREAWTDERLDDLKITADDGFKEMRTEFRALRNETATQSAAMQRLIIQMAAGMFGTMLIGFLGVVATILVHG
jgi:hypothetical protein